MLLWLSEWATLPVKMPFHGVYFKKEECWNSFNMHLHLQWVLDVLQTQNKACGPLFASADVGRTLCRTVRLLQFFFAYKTRRRGQTSAVGSLGGGVLPFPLTGGYRGASVKEVLHNTNYFPLFFFKGGDYSVPPSSCWNSEDASADR